MGFLGFANVYAMRVNLSVAMVAMVNNTSPDKNHSAVTGQCPAQISQNGTSSKEGEFSWSEAEQGWILGSFFYGYVLTQIPGGRIAELYGGKKVYGIGVLVTAVLTLVTPWAARTHLYLLVAVRVLEGLGEGVTFPAMHAILAQWTPPVERSKMGSRVYSGAQFGTVISLPVSGILCDKLGWEWVFYVFGCVGIVWFIFWCLIVHDRPSSHPRISSHERAYIETSLRVDASRPKPAAVPWKAILTSVPVWGLAAAHVAQNWGFYTLLTELPTYMKNILQFDIKENAVVSAFPYLMMWLVAVGWSNVADALIEHSIFSVTTTRKISNSLSAYIPAVLLVLVGFTGCWVPATLTLLALSVGVNGTSSSGYMANHLDLANNYAGTLLGFTNGLANIMGFLAPTIIGYIINGHDDLAHWQTVFFISSVVYVVGNTIFVVVGTAEEQSWNQPGDEQHSQTQQA